MWGLADYRRRSVVRFFELERDSESEEIEIIIVTGPARGQSWILEKGRGTNRSEERRVGKEC